MKEGRRGAVADLRGVTEAPEGRSQQHSLSCRYDHAMAATFCGIGTIIPTAHDQPCTCVYCSTRGPPQGTQRPVSHHARKILVDADSQTTCFSRGVDPRDQGSAKPQGSSETEEMYEWLPPGEEALEDCCEGFLAASRSPDGSLGKLSSPRGVQPALQGCAFKVVHGPRYSFTFTTHTCFSFFVSRTLRKE